MSRFFVRSTQIDQNTVTILGEDAHHISRSLRMAVGEEITVSDMENTEYRCRLERFLPDRVIATVLDSHPCEAEAPFFLMLFQALSKGDKLDLVIQKAVECGVSSITPFESERSVVRIKQESEAHKTERRARIAEAAAKQCGRGMIPAVHSSVSFTAMLESASVADLVLFCYEGEGTVPIGKLLATTDLSSVKKIAIIVGAEGGFSENEANAAAARGFAMTGLGPRILRTETAPIFALAAISAITELS